MLTDRFRSVRSEEGWVLAERLDVGVPVAVWPWSAAVGTDDTERLRMLDALGLPGLVRARALGVGGEADGAFGVAAGQAYLILEASDLEGTEAWDDTGPSLTPPQRLAVATQMAWTLRCVHAGGQRLGAVEPRALRIRPSGETVRAAWAAPGVPGAEEDDLLALGRCLRVGLPESPSEDSDLMLVTLCSRLADPDGERRPSAAEAFQRLLEWAPRASAALTDGALVRELPPVGREVELEALLALARRRLVAPADAPAWALVEGESGSGVRELLRELARRLQLEGSAAEEAPAAPDAAGLIWTADLGALDVDGRERLVRAVQRSALEERACLFAIGTTRTDAAEREALEGLSAVAPPEVIQLSPLERTDLARLVEVGLNWAPPPALLDVIERWSGGLPERVADALERVRAEGVLVRVADGWRLEAERLADLPPALPDDAAAFPPRATRDQRRLLRALSVASSGATRAALEQVAGLAGPALEAAAAPLLEAGLLSADADALRFTRARARLRALASLRVREEQTLRRAHVVWLETLEPAGDVLSALADHSLALGDAQRSARYVPAAAAADEQAGRRLRGLERRLAWRPLLGSVRAAVRAGAWRDLGEALAAVGRLTAAEEAFGQALATRSADVGPLERAQLHRQRAACALRRGDAVAAAEAVERARRALTRVDAGVGVAGGANDDYTLEEARLLGLEVQVALKGGDRARVLSLTAPTFERAGSDRARGSLLNLRGLAHFHRGEPDQARRCFDISLEICEELELAVGVAVTLGNLALVEDYEGRPERAAELHQRSLEVAEAAGAQGQVGAAASNLGNLANRAGRLERARAHYRHTLSLAAASGDDEAVCIGLCALADTFLAQGDPRSALPYAERARSLARVIGVPYCEALAQVNAADALARLGRLDVARATAQAAVALRRDLGEPARLARALALEAWIADRSGDREQAESLTREALEALGDDPHPVARGEVALGQADADALERAEAAFGDAHARLGLARVGVVRARRALEAGRREEAGRAAGRAQAEAEACGARALAAAAELIVLEAGPDVSDRGLDRARGVRSLAHRHELPELARRAAGVLTRLHDLRGEVLEAGASRLDARRVVETQCAQLPAAVARRLRARPGVARDLLAPEEVAAAPEPRRDERARAGSGSEPAAPRLEDCLAAAATLLRADRCALVRTGRSGNVLVGAHDPTGDPNRLRSDEERALVEQPAPNQIVTRVLGRAAALVVTREAPFGPAEAQIAAGLGAALAEHVDEVDPLAAGSLRPLEQPASYGLVGRSPTILAVIRHIERFAPYDLPVLIQGESGTGKELAARALHEASPRRDGPFVAVNASAFSDELIASELFGAVRGAYTGATEDRAGIFELAHTGTLLLDEIADAPANVQAMLLRVLEEGEVRRVGGTVQIVVDVRVVCSSLRDLPAEVAAGRFRQDLYYRLCGLELRLPPLRERREDIGLLAAHILERAAAEGRREARLGAAALRRLEEHSWPGNVRELRNTMERALALGSGSVVEVADLGLPVEPQQPVAPGSLSSLEREAIARALDEHPTLTAAARALGIHRRTLRRRMERYDLHDRG